MAEALESFYPGIKFGIGPPIEQGFYYDVDLPMVKSLLTLIFRKLRPGLRNWPARKTDMKERIFQKRKPWNISLKKAMNIRLN